MNQGNKRIIVYLIFLFLFISMNTPLLQANNNENTQSLSFTFSFDQPILNTTFHQNSSEQYLEIKDLFQTKNTLNITVPVKPVRVLLPYERTIDKLSIETSSPLYLTLPSKIESQSVSIKTFNKTSLEISQDSLTQSSDNHSTPIVEHLGVQYVRGYPIVHINLYPVHLLEDQSQALFYDQISITITTKETSLNPLFRNKVEDEDFIKQHIHNPALLDSYRSFYHPKQDSSTVDYVIITTEELKNADEDYSFQDLIQYRESQGLSCRIKTVESIYAEYPGIDEKQQIRNFIKDAYQTWDTSWILLGGDVEQVPIRYLWDFDGQDTVVSSDLYYQCLDGSYNSNNNGKWGEKYDGVNGERIDLFAEVYIGRAPVDDAIEVSSFVEKTIVYEQSDWGTDEYVQHHVSVGEFTWDGPGGWGAGYVERCIDYWTEYNHATHGISSQVFTITRLYERDSTWTKQDLIQTINSGTGIINHVGHGSYSAAMKLFYADIHNLENEGMYSLLYTQACHSGQLEKQDCFAEEWVTAEKKGGFAAIMNSGVGYGGSINYDGADNRFAREFFDALFSNDEQISSIGRANQDSKEDNFFRIDEPGMHMYHVYYNKNLFGDPYVKIKGSEGTIADFRWTPSYPETGDEIQFDDESTGNIISWEWRFGDGHSSSQQHPSHSYTMPGEYTVKLTIMDSKGYLISTSKEIEVRNFWEPIVTVSYSYEGSNEFTFSFTGNESFDPDGHIVNWTWDFDDGTQAYTANTDHQFPDYGSYECKLIAKDDEGNTGIAFFNVDIIDVLPPEQLMITGPTGGIAETLYNFQVLAIDPQDLPLRYAWDWGDGSSVEWTDFFGSGMHCPQTHEWSQPGTYTIRVKAKNSAGVESEWSDGFTISLVQNDPPVVDMVSPANGIYVNEQKILPFFRPIILGDITLEFSVVDGNGIAQVELFINDIKIDTYFEEPYSFVWEKEGLMPLRHQIKIIAEDESGKTVEELFYVINI